MLVRDGASAAEFVRSWAVDVVPGRGKASPGAQIRALRSALEGQRFCARGAGEAAAQGHLEAVAVLEARLAELAQEEAAVAAEREAAEARDLAEREATLVRAREAYKADPSAENARAYRVAGLRSGAEFDPLTRLPRG